MNNVLHFYRHHRKGCDCDEMSCPTCGGGLFTCSRCGASEGQLPTHCPGEEIDCETLDAIFEGTIDYHRLYGWVEKRKSAS